MNPHKTPRFPCEALCEKSQSLLQLVHISDITHETVQLMNRTFGSKPEDIHAFIGPSIKYTGTQSAKYVIRHRPGSLVQVRQHYQNFLLL